MAGMGGKRTLVTHPLLIAKSVPEQRLCAGELFATLFQRPTQFSFQSRYLLSLFGVSLGHYSARLSDCRSYRGRCAVVWTRKHPAAHILEQVC